MSVNQGVQKTPALKGGELAPLAIIWQDNILKKNNFFKGGKTISYTCKNRKVVFVTI